MCFAYGSSCALSKACFDHLQSWTWINPEAKHEGVLIAILLFDKDRSRFIKLDGIRFPKMWYPLKQCGAFWSAGLLLALLNFELRSNNEQRTKNNR